MARGCPPCPGRVPVVSGLLASQVVGRLTAVRSRLHLVGVCVDWLTTTHPGFSTYLGVVARRYHPDERVAIEADLWRVAVLPCPFAVGDDCLLGGLCQSDDWRREDHRGPWGWLPTSLLRLLDRPLLRDLGSRRLIADAKLAGLTRREGFPIIVATTGVPVVAVSPSMPRHEKEAADGLFPATLPARPD